MGSIWDREKLSLYSCISLPVFHAFTGWNQVSFFSGKGKRSAWEVWKKYDEVTSAFISLSKCPSVQDLLNALPKIERFVVLLYDRTNLCSNVNQARKDLFARKGRSLEGIPPTLDVLTQHIKRAVYQAGFCWAQSLLRDATLPDSNEWGWKVNNDNKYDILWMTLPEVSSICQELTRCGCNPEKGCKGRCKCLKASIKCTALCNCRGDCE